MNKMFEQQLVVCLDLMEQGMSVSDVLVRYPDQADDLRPFLEITAQLSQLATNPTIAQQNKSQAAFLSQAAAVKTASVETRHIWFWLQKLLLPVVALSMLLVLFAGGLFAASASALPGDSLYAFKRQFETLQLQLITAPDEKLRLIEQFSAERQHEVETLLLSGRTAEAKFDGLLEAIADDAWIVSNIRVEVSEQTLIAGTPQIGAQVRVTGLADNGRFAATIIEILSFVPPDPERLPTVVPPVIVLPTSTASSSPTPTPSATETAVPTITLDPTETPTPTATNTPEALETETAVPSATLIIPLPTVTPHDNNNDNEDDNSNDEDDDNGDENNENEEDNDNGDEKNNENDDSDNDNENDNDDDSNNGND